MITLCVPTLNRYDLLNKLIGSAERGLVKPDKYLVVDNGSALDVNPNVSIDIKVYKPGKNIGVAASWNWLIKNSSEIRIICNDDIEVHFDTIDMIIKHYDEKKLIYPAHIDIHNIYSFFIISDYVYNLVGEFDESISPSYAYFEDNDYDFRLKEIREKIGKENLDYMGLPCGYRHIQSSTLQNFNAVEREDHHRKFKIAQTNFLKKWGRLPDDN